jgi:hypothetical protein
VVTSVKGSFSTARDRAARKETFNPLSDVKYLTAALSSTSPCSAVDGGGLSGGVVAGLLDDESPINEAKVLAVLDAVEATAGGFGGNKKDGPDETGRGDVDGSIDDCVGGVNELDDDPNPENPENFVEGALIGLNVSAGDN